KTAHAAEVVDVLAHARRHMERMRVAAKRGPAAVGDAGTFPVGRPSGARPLSAACAKRESELPRTPHSIPHIFKIRISVGVLPQKGPRGPALIHADSSARSSFRGRLAVRIFKTRVHRLIEGGENENLAQRAETPRHRRCRPPAGIE